METISLKLDNDFLQIMEKTMKRHNYTTKTEFIRSAIRSKIKDLENEELLLRAKKLYGTGTPKHRTTDKDIHRAGEKAFKELERDIRK